ncbi:hypothetical protein EV1_011899 [Malus domestica]
MLVGKRNGYLKGVTTEINHRQTITVLTLDNGAMSSRYVHEESRNKSDAMNDDYNNLIQDYYAVLQNDGDVSERDGTTQISWWSWNTPTDVQAAEKEKRQRVKRRKQKRR